MYGCFTPTGFVRNAQQQQQQQQQHLQQQQQQQYQQQQQRQTHATQESLATHGKNLLHNITESNSSSPGVLDLRAVVPTDSAQQSQTIDSRSLSSPKMYTYREPKQVSSSKPRAATEVSNPPPPPPSHPPSAHPEKLLTWKLFTALI